MLRIISFFFFCCLFSFLSAQEANDVLFSVDDTDVTVEEFKYIYEKNNGDNANYSKKSVDEYLELYKKFKLKVNRAKELQLDTIPSLKKELNGYRRQLASSYLKDKEVTNNLVNEVMERKKTDRKVGHIFFSLKKHIPRDQKKKIRAKAQDAYNRIQRGESFEAVAKDVSEDNASAKNGGLMGYYTAPLPSGFYAFENAMYSTPVGKVAEPIESNMGIHIIKVYDERDARGELNIAHILIKNKKDGIANPKAKSKIDSIYRVLLKDSKQFESIAKTLSEDKKTRIKGGNLGSIRINQYEDAFEEAAFGMANDGDISAPVQTSLGWHIIKRLGKKAELDEDRQRIRLKNKLAKDDRLELSEQSLINKIKKDAGLTVDKSALITFRSKLNEDFYSYRWRVPKMDDKTLMSFATGEEYGILDFGNYCKKNTKERLKFNKSYSIEEIVNHLFDGYTDEKVLEYEEKNLEKKYPDFRSLMREYEEGILLFEVQKLEVWDKASKDTVGLQAYYQDHQNDYQWEERALVQEATVNTDNAKLMGKVKKALGKMSLDKVIKKFGSKGVNFDISDATTITKSSKDAEGLKWGSTAPMYTNETENTLTLKKVKSFLPRGNKSFDEAKGYIIADYQDELEKNWIKSLTSKYKLNVNQNILDKLYK